MSVGKYLTIIALIVTYISETKANPYQMQWLAYPHPDDTAQVWFRNSYEIAERPVTARITIASTGYFELYVNERNVTGDVLTPLRERCSANAIAVTYDVTRFMRVGTNTVAVWYSPSFPHPESRQIALSFYGRAGDGSPQVFDNDSSWLCRKAVNTLSAEGYELLGMEEKEPRWNAEDIDIARWLPARIVGDNECVPIEHRSRMYEATRISRIRQQKYFDIEGDSVVYDFGEAFVGLVRVTLRDAVKGQNMRIGDMRYVCSGEADEQAIQRFTTTDCRRLLISGDENFDNAQIQKVEALETETYTRDMKE